MALDPSSSHRERVQRPGSRIAACVSRFHADLTGAMLESARHELAASGADVEQMPTVWVPGAFELPLVARRLARRDDVDAVLCFGLVLKGETTHDHWVAQGAVQGLVQVALECDKPVLLGILTCDTLDQARARALPPELGGREDKGREVARAAIETLVALDEISGRGAIETETAAETSRGDLS